MAVGDADSNAHKILVSKNGKTWESYGPVENGVSFVNTPQSAYYDHKMGYWLVGGVNDGSCYLQSGKLIQTPVGVTNSWKLNPALAAATPILPRYSINDIACDGPYTVAVGGSSSVPAGFPKVPSAISYSKTPVEGSWKTNPDDGAGLIQGNSVARGNGIVTFAVGRDDPTFPGDTTIAFSAGKPTNWASPNVGSCFAVSGNGVAFKNYGNASGTVLF